MFSPHRTQQQHIFVVFNIMNEKLKVECHRKMCGKIKARKEFFIWPKAVELNSFMSSKCFPWIINFSFRFFREEIHFRKIWVLLFPGENLKQLNGVRWHAKNSSLNQREISRNKNLFLMLKIIGIFWFSLPQLRREQELQQQKLWRDFQEQKKELELQHKMQIESKLQVSLLFLSF